jgi:hypothetical protein
MHVPIEQIEQSHLEGLINSKTAEARDIDYKRETYTGGDAAHAEFLADVSSFANALGGDLVIGMAATKGIPTKFAPFMRDADAELLRLEQMALRVRAQNSKFTGSGSVPRGRWSGVNYPHPSELQTAPSCYF